MMDRPHKGRLGTHSRPHYLGPMEHALNLGGPAVSTLRPDGFDTPPDFEPGETTQNIVEIPTKS